MDRGLQGWQARIFQLRYRGLPHRNYSARLRLVACRKETPVGWPQYEGYQRSRSSSQRQTRLPQGLGTGVVCANQLGRGVATAPLQSPGDRRRKDFSYIAFYPKADLRQFIVVRRTTV